MKRASKILLSAAVAFGLKVLLMGQTSAGTITGVVRLEGGQPAEGAWVRVRTTNNLAHTASDGSFQLQNLAAGAQVTVTAWYAGYKVGWAEVTPPAGDVAITLRPWDSRDNAGYQWNTSYADPANPTLGCGHCMSPALEEWKKTAHAGAGTNPRFFSMYNGANLKGTAAVLPGYKTDFPGTAGNCATCHAPGAAADASFTTDMNSLTGVNREGVFCEFCHKVGFIYLDPATGRPYPNAPGTTSMRLYRPSGDDQIFFGSIDDVARRVSYLPVERESEFCAPCHQFSFWGTPIYESFREWQESPYPAQGVKCQSCHMPVGTSATFCLPEKGGLVRDPERLASHLDLGVKDLDFMRATMEMKLTAQAGSTGIDVSVSLLNKLGGHHVPTDYPGRHLVLTVSATDAQGRALTLLGGPVTPGWCGDLSGRPGKGYAKILRDVSTGESPVVSYWKRSRIVSDNRIPALATDVTHYTFQAPAAGGETKISVRLVFRRLFQSLAKARGWEDADIVLAEAETVLKGGS